MGNFPLKLSDHFRVELEMSASFGGRKVREGSTVVVKGEVKIPRMWPM